MNTKKVVLLLLNITIVLCTNTLSIAQAKGTFSFGFATDRTEQKYDVSGRYGSSFEVSVGYQMTFGCFYKQDWWMVGVSMGPGYESYIEEIGNRGHLMGTNALSVVTEGTLAGFKSIYRTLYITGGIIPSAHLSVGGETQHDFAMSPYLGLAFCPIKRFSIEARAGYDPFFRQARFGLGFRF